MQRFRAPHAATLAGTRVLALLSFGLLGAVGAHALVFGRAHVIGGAQNSHLVGAFYLAGLVVALAILARGLLCNRACAADGATLATALRATLPSLRATILTAAAWFATIEASESAHAIPYLAIVLTIPLLCAALLAGAQLIAALLGAARLALASLQPHLRSRTVFWRVRDHGAPRAPQRAHVRYLFSRPPPLLA